MALADVKVRAAKASEKAHKPTDAGRLILLVYPNGSKY